jgi:hypothetical protein
MGGCVILDSGLIVLVSYGTRNAALGGLDLAHDRKCNGWILINTNIFIAYSKEN